MHSLSRRRKSFLAVQSVTILLPFAAVGFARYVCRDEMRFLLNIVFLFGKGKALFLVYTEHYFLFAFANAAAKTSASIQRIRLAAPLNVNLAASALPVG